MLREAQANAPRPSSVLYRDGIKRAHMGCARAPELRSQVTGKEPLSDSAPPEPARVEKKAKALPKASYEGS